MAVRRAIVLALAWLALVASALPGSAGPARAADDYTLESAATYDLRPDEGAIGVIVQLTLTNTTPDPEGQFSVFSEIKVAIHGSPTLSKACAKADSGSTSVYLTIPVSTRQAST